MDRCAPLVWLALLYSYQLFSALYTDSDGLTGSVQNWFTFFIGAFSGRLLDAGLFLPTLIVGSVIQILGIFFMSLSTTYWQLMLTQGIMTGLGGGIVSTRLRSVASGRN